MLKKRLFLYTIVFFTSAVVLGQPCQVLDDALKYYENGDFERILPLKAPLNTLGRYTAGCTEEKVIELLRLKAEAYAVMGDIKNAKRKIGEILQLKPNFETNYIHSDRFKILFDWVKHSTQNDIITSVSKGQDSLYLAPSVVTVITAEEIQQRGYRHIGELFYDVAGIDISEAAGQAIVYMRGFRPTEGTAGLLLMVDGIKQNSPWSQEIYLSELYALSNIKRIEIIYGSQSALYGSEAFNGIINIVTQKADDLLPNREQIGFIGSVSQKLNIENNYASSDRTELEGTLMVDFRNKAFLTLTSKYSKDNRKNLIDSLYKTPYIPKSSSTYDMIFDTVSASLRSEARIQDSLGYNSEDILTSITQPHETYMLSGKFNVDNLELSGSYYNYQDENTELFNDRRHYGILASNTLYKIGAFNIKYNKYITNNLFLNVVSSYQLEDITLTYDRLYAFITGDRPLTESNLATPTDEKQTYTAHSQEFKNELGMDYRASNFLNLRLGVEYKIGSLQGNYVLQNEDYHFFVEDLNAQKFAYQSYLNDNIAAYFQATYRVPFIKTLILSGVVRADYFKLEANSYSYPQDDYYFKYASFFNDYFYTIPHTPNDGFYTYVDTSNNRVNFQPPDFSSQLNTFQRFVSPRLSIVYHTQWDAINHLTCKFIYAKGVKTLSQKQRLGGVAGIVLNNPFNYTPATNQNIDVQLKYQRLSERHQINLALTGYTTNHYGIVNLDGRIALNNIPTDITLLEANIEQLATYNIGNQTVKGLFTDFSYTYQAKNEDQFSIFGNYALTDAKKANGLYTAGVARHKFNIGFNALVWDKQLNMSIRVNRVGDRSISNTTSLVLSEAVDIPAYTKVNAALTYHWLNTGLDFQVAVNNLLNTTIFHTGIGPADGVYYKNAIQQDGRIFTARMIYDLNKSRKIKKLISFLK